MKYTLRHCTCSLFLIWIIIGGCTVKPSLLEIEGHGSPLTPGTILDTAQDRLINFDQLVQRLSQARVIYVGERHTAVAHHKAQLQIIQALTEKKGHLQVGMEMFDHTYQHKLDQWSAGKMQWPKFLKQVHWYANWRFDDNLYKDILVYIQTHHLKLVGINIPFNLPPKIAVGGLDSLSESERALLPKTIDTTQADHRSYVEKVFKSHHIQGRRDFEDFYAAQCAWEDGMAHTIANHTTTATMVVVVGNGHIVRKFGVPNRAFVRNPAPFMTVYLATPHMTVERQDADFIWVTAAEKPTMHGM